MLALRRLRWAAQRSAKMRYCCVEGVADSLLKLACWAPSTCASAESPEPRPSCSPKTRTVTSCPHLVRLWWVCLLRLSAALLVRGAAPLIDTANLASNHASNLDLNLGSNHAPASRPRLKMSSILPLAILCGRETRGVLPEIGWFSSNECTLGRTPRSSVGVKNEKPQLKALRLQFGNRSLLPAECHVDENHPISGMLRGSN